MRERGSTLAAAEASDDKTSERNRKRNGETRSGLFWDFLRISNDISFVDTGMVDSDEVLRV